MKILLIVNLGTPDKPKLLPVFRYLIEFLNDRRVIDIPWLFRRMLVNLIIGPFRAHKSSRRYKRLWSRNGSPMLVNLDNLVASLQAKLNGRYVVMGAMRYGKPALNTILAKIRQANADSITVFPLYPQYASSTSGSVSDFIMKQISKWEVIPDLRIINHYYSHPAFIGAFASRISKLNTRHFDHIVFSYHGLPVRHIEKTHPGISCRNCTCITSMPDYGLYCYKAACYETTRLIVEQLKIKSQDYTVAFQSRISKNWLTPYTDSILIDLAAKGIKTVLVVAPSFVSDCLETTIEIGEEYKSVFQSKSGLELVLAESLNNSDEWVNAIAEIIS